MQPDPLAAFDAYSDKELEETFFLGAQAEQFWRGDLGRYLYGVAVQDKQRALDALSNVDPQNAIEVQRLQNAVAVPRLAIQWIDEIIQKGREAKAQYNQNRGVTDES